MRLPSIANLVYILLYMFDVVFGKSKSQSLLTFKVLFYNELWLKGIILKAICHYELIGEIIIVN